MILLFTDFGVNDFYVGQVRVAIRTHAPGAEVVDLLHSAPNFQIEASAHLLAALARHFPLGSVCLAVVDPGVGTSRDAVAMQADGKWYVAPDNGLLSVVAARSRNCDVLRIKWRPENLSHTFHGRDLFAPIAAWLDSGGVPPGKLERVAGLKIRLSDADLGEIIYFDHYGNALTGLQADTLPDHAVIGIGECMLSYAQVFADAVPGKPFWYRNSIGLVEIAQNGRSARDALGLKLGDAVRPQVQGMFSGPD